MSVPLAVLVLDILCGFVAAVNQGELPRVETKGDALPLLSRGSGDTARSRSCTHGTEFIVTFIDDVQVDHSASILNDRLGPGPINRFRSLRHPGTPEMQLNAMTLCVPPEEDVDSHLQVLMAMEGVQAVEENLPVNLLSTPWNLDRLDQTSLPLDGWYEPGRTGRGIRVYVTDTGTDSNHPQFEGRVQAGYSAVDGQYATRDMGNHGTHCSGIVGSRDYGVAKQVTIIPVKVFSDWGGGASAADIVEGINWVISQEQAFASSSVLSMSLGMASRSFYAGNQALQKATAVGIIPVVAAGNDAGDACGYWPAQSQSTITVGSTDVRDARSSFSNFGSCVDVYAPGSNILSTLPNSQIGYMSGTSMACPAVAGIVALYLESHPTAQFSQMKSAIIRNTVGQRNVASANRMLLVQAKETTNWSLMSGDQSSLATEMRSVHLTSWAMPLTLGCLIAVAVGVIVVRTRKLTKELIREDTV